VSDWRLRNDSTEALRKRLASWKRDDIPGWLRDTAPKVIADLEREIAEREHPHGSDKLTDISISRLRALLPNDHRLDNETLVDGVDAVDLRSVLSGIEQLQRENEALREENKRAWTERNTAYTKVKAWESVVYVEGLPLRAVRVEEWGPGEGTETAVPDITPKKLTELLDELAALREQEKGDG
jgi:uncharacterized protein (UPF0335 family)